MFSKKLSVPVLFLVILFLVIGLSVFSRKDRTEQRAQAVQLQQVLPATRLAETSKQSKKVYARDEFTALVKGKRMNEVVALLGKPNQNEDLNVCIIWHYFGITKDRFGDIDHHVTLMFEGVVSKVLYSSN